MNSVKGTTERKTRFSGILTRVFTRWSGTIALVGTLLGIVSTYYSVLLFGNLRTDFRELLPTEARSVIDLREVTERLESIDNLAVLVFSKNTDASRRFVVDLARELEKVPRSVISSVEYKIDRELQFFKSRQALYMDLEDLEKVRDYVRDRIEFEKQLYNPLTIFSESELPEPHLDFLALRQKYDGKTSVYERLPGGFYATPDETKRAVLIYMPGGGASGIDAGTKLKETVVATIERLKPSSYSPDLEIKYTGGVQDALEENAALVADLLLSTVIVTLICTLAMWIFFRSMAGTLALTMSLFMGTFWTFGLSYFVVGYLNANSAFLGSIVLGNGINFSIIFLARYIEERREGRAHADSLTSSIVHTATATWTASLAAGLAYGSLMLTSFRGFNQFGVIGLFGMVLCWLSTFTVMPAYLTLADRWFGLAPRNSAPPKSYLMEGVAKVVSGAPKLIWTLAIIVSIVSASTFIRFNSGILQTDLSKLRNKESMVSGSAFLSKYLDEIFQRYLSPMVILPRNRENARKIAELLRDEQKKQGKDSLISSVQTLDDFIPRDQSEKIEVLRQIQALLPPKILQRLAPADQAKAAQLLTPESLKPIREQDLPPLVLSKFTEKDGSRGKLVLVEPPLSNATWEGQRLIEFISSLRRAADQVENGAPVAGTIVITADMISSISRDGPRATLFAFVAVLLLVIILFRNPSTVFQTLLALLLGVLWMSGIILGFDLKINFLNFIALPITFGIGVDYGVNICQRYREEGGKDILAVIRQTGGAVAMCSFTTIVGFGSLLIAGNQGFVSFGTLAVAGELTCVIAAIVALPAYLLLRDRQRAARTGN